MLSNKYSCDSVNGLLIIFIWRRYENPFSRFS
ncbi:hypothetical protein [Yersinia phage vB_YenS-P840]|nr:hypothetical protein [Yersinia phage vB_YenS-P840]